MLTEFHYEHPDEYRDGTRVLLLKARHKDGTVGKERALQRVVHRTERFNEALAELRSMLRPGERIYASASQRDVRAAARSLQSRQVDAIYDADPLDFYRHLEDRWCSCVMRPESEDKSSRRWLFDCDDDDQYKSAKAALLETYRDQWYAYPSKRGYHIITRPFDPSDLPDHVKTILHRNPIMLWSYK